MFGKFWLQYRDKYITEFKKSLRSSKNITVIFIVVVFIAIFFGGVKLFAGENENDVFVKVKMSQGLWWATAQKPNIWFVEAIHPGDIETNLLGNPVAEIVELRYYPALLRPEEPETSYEVYLTIKLSANYNERTQKYTYNRSAIGVGAPIDLEFSDVQISGTIIQLSDEPIKDEYVEKIIYLISEEGYTKDLPFIYDNIIVGGKYFDGTENVFEILDKDLQSRLVVSSDLYGKLREQYIIVKAKIRVKKSRNNFIFGEEQILRIGNRLNLTTSSYNFQDFIVRDFE